MATKKDLLEAHSFSRRRLITAFVSGAPGGREVEPARPARTIVGGIALAVLLAAGAAIAGVFAPTGASDWRHPGLIISKETGSSYVITDGTPDSPLHPVINATSATLILGSDAEPILLPQDVIDDQSIGEEIGILGAPATLPASSLLIDPGWTACTSSDTGIRVQVSERPDVTPAPSAGVTVRSGDDYFVVVSSADSDLGAFVYPVPAAPQIDNLLQALGLQPTGSAVHVSRKWVSLFPVGAPLARSSFEIRGFGDTSPYAGQDGSGVLRDHHIGDLLVTPDGQQLLVTQAGAVQLSDFAASVYRNVPTPEGGVLVPDEVARAPVVAADTTTLADARWPQEPPSESLELPCAQLTAKPGLPPRVQLTNPGTDSGSIGVSRHEIDRRIAPGRGSYVLSGTWTDVDHGSPYLLDSQGRANPLVGDDTGTQLGYADHRLAVVPAEWIELFGCGVDLSQDAALSAPGPVRDLSPSRRHQRAGCSATPGR